MAQMMGIDVGTTGCKASIFDESGVLVAEAYREYPLICPKPAWAELDPAVVWSAIKEAMRGSLDGRGPRSPEVKSVSVSSQGEAFLALSREGKPLHNSIVTPDQRAQEQTKLLQDAFGAEYLFQKTGMVLFPIYTLNKILWIRDNAPKVYERTAKFLCWEDYVNYLLTGNPVIDHSLANRTLMFEIGSRQWSDEILEDLEIDLDLLAEAVPGGTPVGEVTGGASKETGLSRGTLVVAGGHDQACGCLGAGIVDEGPLYDVTGTVECLMPSLENPVLTQEMFKGGFSNYCHVLPDRYLILGYNMTAGTILRWLRDLLSEEGHPERASTYRKFDEMAAAVPPGSEGLIVLPYFMGAATPNWDTHARGTIVGLTLAHGRAHLIRAVMEGVTFELKNNLESLVAAGIGADEIRAVGGGARSDFWCQLKADITQRPVVVPRVTEASALGAAILAGVGSGVYRSYEDGVARAFAPERRYEPGEKDAYDRTFDLYRRSYDALREIYAGLSDIRSD